MSSQEPLLEDLFWRSPEWADAMGGVHENSVLFYFAKSPFFDTTSGNASLETQAQFNGDIAESLSTRPSFEAQLDKLSGIEYRVHVGPMDFGPEAWPNQGRWVIRKQNRRIDYSGSDYEATVDILATYFVVGISVYEAPSVSEMMASRLLSATSSMKKIMQKASSLTRYSPSLGHHYLPPNLKQRDEKPRTPGQSRESSMAPDGGSQLSATSKSTKSKGGDYSTLIDAYQQFNNYGNEYIDENPLMGEPGSFVFSSSREHVQARREAEAKRAQQQADLKKAQEDARTAAAASRAQSEAPKVETPAVKQSKPLTPSRKGSRAPDGESRSKKRRKSTKPVTPSTTVG